jgi:hypothetical protein
MRDGHWQANSDPGKAGDPLTGHKDQEDQRGTRREYASGSLARADLASDPLSQFTYNWA